VLDGGHQITLTNGTKVAFHYMSCNGSQPVSVDISKLALGKLLLKEWEREKL
jgi:hypothetical protein